MFDNVCRVISLIIWVKWDDLLPLYKSFDYSSFSSENSHRNLLIFYNNVILSPWFFFFFWFFQKSIIGGLQRSWSGSVPVILNFILSIYHYGTGFLFTHPWYISETLCKVHFDLFALAIKFTCTASVLQLIGNLN